MLNKYSQLRVTFVSTDFDCKEARAYVYLSSRNGDVRLSQMDAVITPFLLVPRGLMSWKFKRLFWDLMVFQSIKRA